MSILVDTNVFLRRMQPANPSHRVAKDAVAQLMTRGEALCFTPQNIAEFWSVATRPVSSNGLGLSIGDAANEVEKIERVFTLLPETPTIYGEWRRIVVRHSVHGVKVHDARLVAAMNVHQIPSILTFDGGDFSRYAIDVIHPSTVVA